MRGILAAHADVVVAYLNGHDHKGGYARDGVVHHLTISGMVEAPEKNAFCVVDVFAERLRVRGFGKVPSRVLEVAAKERR